MTHISRPFQIALAALVLLVAVWFVALRGHSGGESSSSSSSAPTSASSSPSSPSSSQSAPGGGTPASKAGVYHGSAPGVEGLSRAIQRARGAVAQSQQSANQQGSAQSSSGAQKQSAQSQHSQTQDAQKHNAQTQTSQSHSAKQTHAQQKQSQQAQNSQQSKAASGVPAMQAVVEGELKHGKVVAVLFWNPKGAVDATVRRELGAAGRAQHGKLAVHVARSSQVGSFGSFTHAVQVYSTPTILLINAKGNTSSLTGLTDAFSIGQAIKEVKRAK
jgi:hypothetical protein